MSRVWRSHQFGSTSDLDALGRSSTRGSLATCSVGGGPGGARVFSDEDHRRLATWSMGRGAADRGGKAGGGVVMNGGQGEAHPAWAALQPQALQPAVNGGQGEPHATWAPLQPQLQRQPEARWYEGGRRRFSSSFGGSGSSVLQQQQQRQQQHVGFGRSSFGVSSSSMLQQRQQQPHVAFGVSHGLDSSMQQPQHVTFSTSFGDVGSNLPMVSPLAPGSATPWPGLAGAAGSDAGAGAGAGVWARTSFPTGPPPSATATAATAAAAATALPPLGPPAPLLFPHRPPAASPPGAWEGLARQEAVALQPLSRGEAVALQPLPRGEAVALQVQGGLAREEAHATATATATAAPPTATATPQLSSPPPPTAEATQQLQTQPLSPACTVAPVPIRLGGMGPEFVTPDAREGIGPVIPPPQHPPSAPTPSVTAGSSVAAGAPSRVAAMFEMLRCCPCVGMEPG